MSIPVPDSVRRAWPRLRLLGGLLLLAALLWRFGTGPVADAWHVTTWTSVLAAVVVNLGATLASAWRWRVVSRALGAPLGVRTSFTSYYRSQFLNSVLPGGILGDAHRGVRHGRKAGDLGVGLRATVWDRVTGQVVQVGLAVLALAVLGTSLTRLAPVALAVVAVLLGGGWLLIRARRTASAWVGDDLRTLVRPPVSGPITLASLGSTAGHVVVFLVAVHAVGVDASWRLQVTLALVVLVGSAIPLNVAGWGPREGVTAWVFGAAGLGASTGLTVSIEFGVLSALATAPGVLVLVADTLRRRARRNLETEERTLEEARHG
jgi:glycosyltransferase 2 family protein